MGFWILLYIIWVILLQLPYPMPFIGSAGGLFGITFVILAIWYKLPRAWRRDEGFRKKGKYLILSQFSLFFITIEYWVLASIFYVTPLHMQWAIAVLLIFARELGTTALTKLCHKAMGREDVSVELASSHFGIIKDNLKLGLSLTKIKLNLG